MLQVDISGQDPFSDELVVHLDVLSLSMENQVPSQVNVARVVAVEEDGIFDGDVQILENPLNPDGFASCHDSLLYSTSIPDNVIVGCFLLLHEMGLLSREKTNPDVNSLSAL